MDKISCLLLAITISSSITGQVQLTKERNAYRASGLTQKTSQLRATILQEQNRKTAVPKPFAKAENLYSTKLK